HLANLGVEVLRLDAIAFIWKRLGTTSQNQPEVHAITQVLRAVARIACPAVVFLAEAIVAPADLLAYLGTGARFGKVSDLAYHNSLMVQLWSMLAGHEVGLAVHALRATGDVPSTTAWITYVRGHDDIGWAIDDVDAAAVGRSGTGHRAFLSDWYSGDFPGSPAHGLVFQHNEATGDRRISGTVASLAGMDDALAADDPGLVDLVIARILLLHSVILGWGGIPVLWMGDELALRNDLRWADESGHGGDNRWVHRRRMPWDIAGRRLVPGTVEQRVFDGFAHRARVRSALPHLHASVAAEPLDATDADVFAVVRRHPIGPFLGVYNVAAAARALPAARLGEVGLHPASTVDALTGRLVTVDADGTIALAPYGAQWLVTGPPG
ncbi:MAG: alpha-amylase, partial [Ilumatobacteraceae bacterium]